MGGSSMSYGRAYAFSTLAVVTALAFPADAQSVISTRSGVVHFFEGVVYLGGEPLEPHLGKFPCMAEGAELRTAQGRAEVLLTPGVFLRIGERSIIRLVANDLSDTRVELLAGSAIVDSAEQSLDTSVTVIYKDWRVRFPQTGIYRIDSEPPRLSVQQGGAEVSAGAAGTPVAVKQGMDLPLAAVLVPDRSIDAPDDALANWAHGRSESIAADNAITAQIDDDLTSPTYSLARDGFTYFPLIGASPLGLGSSSLYSSYTPYQPGFNSIYLPGYTYRPLLLGLRMGGYSGYRGYVPLRPLRGGFSPGFGAMVPAPRAPVSPGRPVIRGVFHGAHR
jgi:hypothetical protein